VVVAQDTTEINYPGRGVGALGGAGRLGRTAGFFIHAAIAVDADEEAVLGVVDARIWTRRGATPAPRRHRTLAHKESSRWLQTSQRAKERLAGAAQVIVVGDRENDIYAVFDGCPHGTDLIVRAAQDRRLSGGGTLFAASAAWTPLCVQTVRVAPRGPGDKGRVATVSVRAGGVRVCHPLHGRRAVPRRSNSTWWKRPRWRRRAAASPCGGGC
jgi:hypothetical protein